MSAYQIIAGLRWYWLCRQHGRVTFDMVRKLVPELFDLSREECQHSRSRQTEPDWLIDMRNFKRTVEAGKNKNFRRDGEGLVLTEEGRKAGKYISLQQMRRVARLKQEDVPRLDSRSG